jgi:hypothetical protein
MHRLNGGFLTRARPRRVSAAAQISSLRPPLLQLRPDPGSAPCALSPSPWVRRPRRLRWAPARRDLVQLAPLCSPARVPPSSRRRPLRHRLPPPASAPTSLLQLHSPVAGPTRQSKAGWIVCVLVPPPLLGLRRWLRRPLLPHGLRRLWSGPRALRRRKRCPRLPAPAPTAMKTKVKLLKMVTTRPLHNGCTAAPLLPRRWRSSPSLPGQGWRRGDLRTCWHQAARLLQLSQQLLAVLLTPSHLRLPVGVETMRGVPRTLRLWLQFQAPDWLRDARRMWPGDGRTRLGGTVHIARPCSRIPQPSVVALLLRLG